MKQIRLTIAGETPLMMHSDQLANPMNEYAQRIKEITGKRQKTAEDHEAIAQLEFLGGIYYNEVAGVHIPSRNLRKCIEKGAALSKKGQTIKRGLMVKESELSLLYDGPSKPADLYRAKKYVDMRTVGNGSGAKKVRVMRTRPIFMPPWGFVATLLWDPQQINEKDLRRCIEDAGQLCGLGDYRMENGGSFGKFRIENWEA